MYQTLVSNATSVSRIAGPVCITRFAMRPAKSFWKNAQDWRIKYQWFCHLIRFDTLAEIAWLAIRFCAVSASGRAISSTSAMPKRCGQNFANSSCGLTAVINVTIRPRNTGTLESRSATTKPAANKAANRPFAWRAKCQKNATKLGGGTACSGDSVGLNSRSKSENMAPTRNGQRGPAPTPRMASDILAALIGCGRVEKLRVGTMTCRAVVCAKSGDPNSTVERYGSRPRAATRYVGARQPADACVIYLAGARRRMRPELLSLASHSAPSGPSRP